MKWLWLLLLPGGSLLLLVLGIAWGRQQSDLSRLDALRQLLKNEKEKDPKTYARVDGSKVITWPRATATTDRARAKAS